MNSEFILLLVYFLNNIQVTVAQPKWSVAMDDKCVFTVSKNWTILFEKNPSLFVTYTKKDNFGECRAACCSHQTCNGYVFDGSDLTDTCKLLKCSRNGTDCKKALKKYDKAMPGEVGFITGLAGATVNFTSSEASLGNHPGNEVPIVIPNEVTSSEVPEPKEERKDNPTQSNSEMGTTRAQLDSKIYLLPSTSGDAVVSESVVNPTLNPEEMVNYTHVNNYMNMYKEDIKEHTNSISLTIAFLFGLGFLVTVFYLTGRRWIEGIKDRQRRGYTRISYLLNGV